jgi:hypothetical protein
MSFFPKTLCGRLILTEAAVCSSAIRPNLSAILDGLLTQSRFSSMHGAPMVCISRSTWYRPTAEFHKRFCPKTKPIWVTRTGLLTGRGSCLATAPVIRPRNRPSKTCGSSTSTAARLRWFQARRRCVRPAGLPMGGSRWPFTTISVPLCLSLISKPSNGSTCR